MGKNKFGFGFCVNLISDSILLNGVYLLEKNIFYVRLFKNK